MKQLMGFLFFFLAVNSALAGDDSSPANSFADVLGACKIETSTQCKDEKSKKGQVSCLSKKSGDPQAKFTTGCRQKIADQKK